MKIDELKRRVFKDLKYIEKDKFIVKNMIRNSQQKIIPVAKNEEHSRRARTEGNKLYQQSDDPWTNYKVLQLYNESIAYALKGSEDLAAAYGNKSAILRRMLKFTDCVVEADKALNITKSVSLQIKLLCRKAECYTALNISGEKKFMDKARLLFTNSEFSENVKEKLCELINKTQSYILCVKLTNSDDEMFDEIQMQASGMIAEAEKNLSMQSSLRTEYSNKYGLYLVAARDFQPGEIMTVEKPYITQIIDCKSPSYCFQCLNFLWTSVPCDHCSWHVYCSEQCRMEAWNDYHDVECDALQQMKEKIPIREYVDLAAVSLFFKALKEAGSIKELQAELKLIDQCEGLPGEDLVSSKKLMSYKTLYRTRTRIVPDDVLQDCLRFCSCLVIGLAKPVLNTPYDPYELKKLMKNDDAIFLGALLLKFSIINKGRVQQVQYDAVERGCSSKPTNNLIMMTQLLTPLSCVPNVQCGHTYGSKCFMYALEPIKAGTQLFSSIWLSSVYYNSPKAQRHLTFKSFYDFPCDCRACTENWCEKLYDRAQEALIPESKASVEKELFAEIESIKKEMEMSPFYTMKLVQIHLVHKLKSLMVKTWQDSPMPSLVTFEAVKLLIKLFGMFFSCNPRLVYRLSSKPQRITQLVSKDGQ